MSQSGNVAGADAAVWKVGSLSADELERLAGEIRPSWEIGLDAAAEQPANAAAAMIVATSNGFTAAPNAMVADLGGLAAATPKGNVTQVMGAVLAPANATLVAQLGSVPENAAVPLHASSGRMTSPIPLVAPTRPAATQMAYDDAKTEQSTARPWEDDESLAPKKKGKGLLYGVLGGGVVVAGLIAFLAMRGGGDTTAASASTATTTPASEVAPATPPSTSPSANAPTVAAANPVPSTNSQEPVAPPPAPVRAAVAPPAPAVAPHAPVVAPAPQPSPVAVTHAAASSRVAPERSTPHHSSSSGSTARRGGSRVHGAGFVTDSPY